MPKPRGAAKKNSAGKKRAGRGAARQAEAAAAESRSASYEHPEAEIASRPDVGTQASFRKKKPSRNYKYDSSLSPSLEWDGVNASVRERGEELIRRILDAETIEAAKGAAEELAKISRPFLNWSGKAERLSFDVPTLPLFVHERLSTEAILETLKRHKRDKQESLDLFGDPQRTITDQVLRSYQHRDPWVNRLILGDSMVVMNSLLEYEGMGGQVQMIYIDPPYGVKFGSNFQPFVRKRDVKHNKDADMTREPETVQAYRDTWELGLHSYLTYLRDRLLVARDLLTPTGSVFVQISDENLHHMREVMDDVFGASEFCGVIVFRKTTTQAGDLLPATNDFLLWYARDIKAVKFHQIYLARPGSNWVNYDFVALPDGTFRRMTAEESDDTEMLPSGAQIYRRSPLTSKSASESTSQPVVFNGKSYSPGVGGWKTNAEGFARLAAANRLEAYGKTLSYRRYISDFPYFPLSDTWLDTAMGGYSESKVYAVQTNVKVIQRCILMTTEPGDLILDPTCGSGTSAYVAEQWGRRWITIDTSRVPLALARQRLLTATYPWYELREPARGPAGGFTYRRKQNNRGDDVGGIVPHTTLKSIANDEPPKEEVLVDRPEIDNSITRVSGPFVVEATIPTPVDYEGDGVEDSGAEPPESYASFVDRMLEVLRRNPKLQLTSNRTVELRNIRPPAKSMSISADAMVDAGSLPSATLGDVIDEAEEKRGNRLGLSGKPVAIVFGPENGAVSEKLVFNAGKEANARNYSHLFVIGFAIQPNAREMIDNADNVIGLPATYVAATPDILMGDLLKTMRSSQIFSVCGLPEIRIEKAERREKSDPEKYVVSLLGLDTFNPATMDAESVEGNDVPAWFLDTDYNELSFHVSQAFFPRTGAWENLKKSLRAGYDESVWDHLNGTVSTPFEANADTKIAVKVIDTRGNELMVVKTIGEAISKG
ncbi:MAG: site-specific DNA-methyltransferase [Gemmatimonadales bacterium]